MLETTSTSPEVTAVDVTAVDPTTVDPDDGPLSVDQPDGGLTTTPAEAPGTADVAQGLGALPAIAPPCPADVVNHGQYVSGVAHDTPPGPGHGEVVSAAAQSDCGKDVGAAEGDEPAAVATAAKRGDTDPTKPGKGGSNGKDGEGQGQGQGQGGAGNSNGKSNSNAGGNGAAHGGGSPPAAHPRGGNG